jgi:hypothetical protein
VRTLLLNGKNAIAPTHINSGCAAMISNPRFIVLIKSNPEANK